MYYYTPGSLQVPAGPLPRQRYYVEKKNYQNSILLIRVEKYVARISNSMQLR